MLAAVHPTRLALSPPPLAPKPPPPQREGKLSGPAAAAAAAAAMSTPVRLRVYDLSMGMARQMSQQLTGQQFDLIPHTGIEVYGIEYFFGGGVQSLPPATVEATFGMKPCEVVDLGETAIPQPIFEEYLKEVEPRFTQVAGGETVILLHPPLPLVGVSTVMDRGCQQNDCLADGYTQDTYNLFTHNCNNFTDECASFLLGEGIPRRIIDIPSQFLATPLGASLRPMFEQQTEQMNARLGAAGGQLGGPPAPAAAAAAPAGGLDQAAIAAALQNLMAVRRRHCLPLVFSQPFIAETVPFSLRCCRGRRRFRRGRAARRRWRRRASRPRTACRARRR